MMAENATLELYAWLNSRIKIRVDDFVAPKIIEFYKKNEIYKTFWCSHAIIRYGKQKMEIRFEEITKLITNIINSISFMYLKKEHYSSSWSEVNSGADLYTYFSSVNQVVKIAYLDSRVPYPHTDEILGTCFIDNTRGKSQDYRSPNELVTSSFSMWLHSIVERGCVIYTKEYVQKNKIYYPYLYEGLIVLPYIIFFGSFFDQVEHYWRILKEAGFISDSWEVLEKAKEIVKDIRFRLDKNIPLF